MIESVSGDRGDLKRSRRVRNNGHSPLDRLPPHALDMEQGVLGCQLLSPNDTVGEVLQKIAVEAFYDLRHQTIQSELFEMFNSGTPIEVVTVMQRLKEKKLLEQCGGITYLSQLQDATPSAGNLSYYLDIVLEKYLLRKMIQTCMDTVGKIYDYEGEVDTLLDEVERDILAIRPKHRRSVAPTVKQLVQDSITHIEDLHERKGAISGLSTGFIDLDKYTDGLHGGEETIIAAFPGFGKTTLATNIVEHVVLELHKSAGFFTLEMTARQLVTRMICSHAKVNLRNINQGFLSETDFPKMTSAAGKLTNAKMFFDDTSDLTVYELRARARSWWQQHKIELLVVDYLQLLKAPASGKHHRSVTEEIAEVSHQLKHMAKELNIPVIVLSQLTDTGDGRSRLRGSADIGQDADNVFRIQNVKKKDGEEREAGAGVPVHLKILKQRNGATGTIDLVFLKQYTRFENASKVSEEGVPQ